VRRVFTLIELLVVIAIVAVLLAILIPALSMARRHTRLALCGNNLRQIVAGLTLYSDENQGKYPLRKVWNPDVVQWGSTAVPDMRRVIYDYAASRLSGVLWCPILSPDSFMVPWNNPTDLTGEDGQIWGKVFYIDPLYSYPGSLCYRMGYSLYAGLQPFNDSFQWLWANSGNENIDHEPRDTGNAHDVIIADNNVSWLSYGLGEIKKPYSSNHSPSQALFFGGGPFVDTNAGYGDGHVERRDAIKFYVEAIEPGWHGVFQY
jgi:prepilin-type N-terminal cleavage/methylation domain-containing protein